ERTGVVVRITSPPSARFSTGETNFWLPFFQATNAFLGTLARRYLRLSCVSVMDNPYQYDILIGPTAASRVPTSHRSLGQARNFASTGLFPSVSTARPSRRLTERMIGVVEL